MKATYEFLPNGEMTIRYQTTLNRNILQQDDVVQAAKPGSEQSQRTLFAFSGFQDERTALVRGNKPNEKPVATAAESLAAVPRQLGIRFELPQSVDTLAWKREAQWNVYPKNHIGRASGQARAFLVKQDTQEVLGQQPTWAWSQSACPLGTRDFRSTKRNIHRASLTDSAGYGVEVVSDGTQHSRCYVHDDRIHWLIAELDNGPSETFMSNYFDPRRKSVPLDQAFTGAVHVRFCESGA